jgi:uncharacterized protein (DUF58 family)
MSRLGVRSTKAVKIKTVGWIFILLCILMGLGAVNTANNLIYIIVAFMLGIIAVSGIFGALNLKNLSLEVGFPKEIYAGSSFPVSIKLINGRRFFPVFLVRVYIDEQQVLFPFINSADASTKFIELQLDKRGNAVLENIYVSTVFPFNFLRRCKNLKDKFNFVVFPAPISDGLYYVKNGSLNDGHSAKGLESELVSVRSYYTGDSMRLIHWKATARTDSLKVKELEYTGSEPVLIEIENLGGELESKLSHATWLIKHFIAKGIPVGLSTAKVYIAPDNSESHKLEMLEELALYD